MAGTPSWGSKEPFPESRAQILTLSLVIIGLSLSLQIMFYGVVLHILFDLYIFLIFT